MEHSLSTRGHDARIFGDGEKAWHAFQEEEFPLVILDWLMPGLDGLELCRRIRSHPRSGSPFVMVITTRKEPGDLEAVLDAGADDYFAKPISVKMLDIRLTVAETQVEHLLLKNKAEEDLAKAYSKLERSRDDLLSVLGQLRIGTVLTDEEGRITFQNNSARNILQISGEDVLGKNWTEAFPLSKNEIEQLSNLVASAGDSKGKLFVAPQHGGIQRRAEIEVTDDPRNPVRKLFLLYDVSEVHELRKQ